jgi:hypothetical protein
VDLYDEKYPIIPDDQKYPGKQLPDDFQWKRESKVS